MKPMVVERFGHCVHIPLTLGQQFGETVAIKHDGLRFCVAQVQCKIINSTLADDEKPSRLHLRLQRQCRLPPVD